MKARPLRTWRVERLEAVVVEALHLVHATHLAGEQHIPTFVPERFEDLAATGTTLVLVTREPIRGALAAGAAGTAFGSDLHSLELLEDRRNRAQTRFDFLRRCLCMAAGGGQQEDGQREEGRRSHRGYTQALAGPYTTGARGRNGAS
jgi:hypothetical protein